VLANASGSDPGFRFVREAVEAKKHHAVMGQTLPKTISPKSLSVVTTTASSAAPIPSTSSSEIPG
jgi:hypothetical protein